jgi:hypothetical protein
MGQKEFGKKIRKSQILSKKIRYCDLSAIFKFYNQKVQQKKYF